MKRYTVIAILFFIVCTSITFRQFFFKNQIPFPSNLLMAFYAPWKYVSIPGYPNGPPNKPIGFDVIKLFYPYRKFTTEELSKRVIPLWNPYVFSGNVHLATYQSAVFYPLNIVYHVLPLIDAWSILVIIQPILAGFGTYLFLRSLKLSFQASLFGAFTFAFSGWMIAWSEESLVIEHTILWLPFSLYAVERFVESKKVKNLILLAIFLSCSILAGFLQMTVYHFATVLLYGLYRMRGTSIERKYILYFGTFFISACISAVHLIPSIESFFFSPRGVVDARFLFTTYLMKPWHLLTLFAPDFWGNPGVYNYFGDAFYHEKIIYVGIPGVLIALYAMFTKQLDQRKRFFSWLAVGTLLLGFFPVGWILYFTRLPVISAMIPSRIFAVSAFALSILAGYGIESLITKSLHMKHWIRIVCIAALALAIAWGYVVWSRLNDPGGSYARVSLRNLVIPTAFFGLTSIVIFALVRFKKYTIFIYCLLFGISFVSANYFADKFLYFSNRSFVYPQLPVIEKLQHLAKYDRIWGYGNAYLTPNMTTYYHLFSADGYDALYPQRYGELLFTQEKNGMVTDQIRRTDAGIRQASEYDNVVENKYRRTLLSLLGVKYVLESKKGDGKDWSSTEKRFSPDYFRLAWEDESFRIWQYTASLPRAFIAHKYEVLVNKQKIADRLFDETFNLQDKLIIENPPNGYMSQSCENQHNDSVVITSYDSNMVRISADSVCPGLLFLSDNYYPGWKAYVDGKEEKILRADFSFRAVQLTEGKHEVIFSYEPLSFQIGIAITVISLIGVGITTIFVVRYEK